MTKVRNRVAEVLTLSAREIQTNPDNWRTHPTVQRSAVRGLLDEIGIADRLLAYRSERAGGALVLLDGELRSTLEPDAQWTVLVLDVTDGEADLLLLSLDKTTTLADTDKKKVAALMKRVQAQTESVNIFLTGFAQEVGTVLESVAQEHTAFLERFLQEDAPHENPTEGFTNPYVGLNFPATTEQRDFVMETLKAARSLFGVPSSTDALVKICEAWYAANVQEA